MDQMELDALANKDDWTMDDVKQYLRTLTRDELHTVELILKAMKEGRLHVSY